MTDIMLKIVACSAFSRGDTMAESPHIVLTQLEQFEPRFHILGEAGSNGIIGLDNA